MKILRNTKKMVPFHVTAALGAGIGVTAVAWVSFFALIIKLSYVHEIPAYAMGLAAGLPLIAAAACFPIFAVLTRRSIIPAFGHYHWMLIASAIAVIAGFVTLFNLPQGAPYWTKFLYISLSVFVFASGALLYTVTHYKIAVRIAADKTELDKLNFSWLVMTAVAALVTVLIIILVGLPFGRESIRDISYIVGTVSIVSVAASFFGTYNYLPRIEIKEKNAPKISLRELAGALGGVFLRGKRLYILGAVFCLFGLAFCAVTALEILLGLSRIGAGLFATNPDLGSMLFAAPTIALFVAGYFLGLRVAPKNLTAAVRRCCIAVAFVAVFFAGLVFFQISGIIAVIATFALVSLLGGYAGFALASVSGIWEELVDYSRMTVESKRMLSYIIAATVGGLSLAVGGAAVSAAGVGHFIYAVFALPVFVIGVVLLIIAVRKTKNSTLEAVTIELEREITYAITKEITRDDVKTSDKINPQGYKVRTTDKVKTTDKVRTTDKIQATGKAQTTDKIKTRDKTK